MGFSDQLLCVRLLHRLFQVVVRIDDCLALLNLVSLSPVRPASPF